MTHSMIRTAAVAAVAVFATAATLLAGSDAFARGGKEYFQQTYQFDRPMNGYQGFSGAYHCSYVKTPKNVCDGQGRCKRVWELLQTCQ